MSLGAARNRHRQVGEIFCELLGQPFNADRLCQSPADDPVHSKHVKKVPRERRKGDFDHHLVVCDFANAVELVCLILPRLMPIQSQCWSQRGNAVLCH